MPVTRWIPLYDPAARPASWNERMQPGEYAVHFSVSVEEIDSKGCVILSSLPDAEAYAREQVLKHPTLQCRVFDHHGFVGAPIREIDGEAYKGRGEITSRFRRWVGGILFMSGSALFITDWVADFHFDWPSVLGSRLMIPGFVLVVTEGLVMLHHRRSRAQKDGVEGS